MQECIATFEANSSDEAPVLYEAMYEDLAVAWEAKNSRPNSATSGEPGHSWTAVQT